MQYSNRTENMLGRGIHHCPQQQQPALGESPRSLTERALAGKDKNSQLKTFWEIQWTVCQVKPLMARKRFSA